MEFASDAALAAEPNQSIDELIGRGPEMLVEEAEGEGGTEAQSMRTRSNQARSSAVKN